MKSFDSDTSLQGFKDLVPKKKKTYCQESL